MARGSRSTTLVFAVPSPRGDTAKAQAIVTLLDEVLADRNKALDVERNEMVKSLLGRSRSQVRVARWYRITSQLDLMEPLDRRLRATLEDTSATLAARLEMVAVLLEQSINLKIHDLNDEAYTISNDMAALIVRLRQEGHVAEMGDMVTPRWYCTASQVTLLTQIHEAVSHILGRHAPIVSIKDPDSGDITTQTMLVGDRME